jgi:hypothetical protein
MAKYPTHKRKPFKRAKKYVKKNAKVAFKIVAVNK